MVGMVRDGSDGNGRRVVTGYQLSCGHWRSEAPGYGIGSVLSCLECNTLRSVVIGYAGPVWSETAVMG